MGQPKFRYFLFGFFVIIQAYSSYSQENKLSMLLDSITDAELNYQLDISVTSEIKPVPLIIVDGILMERDIFLRSFNLEDIESIDTVSDSLAFELFDSPAWGGFVVIETNLSKRKLRKRIEKQ